MQKTRHRVRLFFDFTVAGRDAPDRIARLHIAQVADPGWLHPTRLAADAARSIGTATLWDWAAWKLSTDFHQYVRDVLNSSTAPTAADQPLVLCRSPATKALLEGRYRGPPGQAAGSPGIVLTLGRSRHPYDVEPDGAVLIDGGPAGVAVAVEIEALSVHLFRTGVGVIVPCLHFKSRERDADIPPGLLTEIIPRLGDERREAAFGWSHDWQTPGSPRFTLGTLLRRLLEPAGCQFPQRERIYSYVTVVTPEPGGHGERDLAFRLSRHYNASYRPTGDFLGTSFVRPFETVLHAASREGASSVVTPGAVEGEPEFLATWLEQAEPRVYFPLQLAAVHEYVALLDMAQGAGAPIDPDANDPATIATLKALRHSFLLFRLRYRLLQVSTITAHELAFAATVHALGIEALSTKIARDLVEVERRLVELASERALALQRTQAARERRRERKTAGLTGLASGALAYITMASLGDHLSEFLSHGGFASERARFVIEVVLQLAGALLACWSFYYAVWWKHGDHHEVEHVLEHQQTELKLAHRSGSGPPAVHAGLEDEHVS